MKKLQPILSHDSMAELQSPRDAASATSSGLAATGIAYSSQTGVESPVSQEDGDSDHH